jgi:hypothetical protein
MQLAAQRITNYWNRRIELFGNDRAFKPLHLGEDGAITPIHDNDNSDDEQFVKHTIRGLSLGFIRPTKTHDSGGRAILFADPSRFAGYDKNNNDERMGVVRAMWLVFHSVIMGNDTVQKLGNYARHIVCVNKLTLHYNIHLILIDKCFYSYRPTGTGVVIVVFPHHAKISTIDRKLIKINIDSLSGCLPIRVGGFHICHPPWFFGKIVYPIMKVVMPTRMSKRIRVHVGSEEKVLENLKQFGLEKNVLPSDIGGDIVL